MAEFTESQICELETIFGLKRTSPTLPVSDGVVSPDQMIWWRGAEGPEYVRAMNDWENIARHPEIYSHTKPEGRFVYEA